VETIFTTSGLDERIRFQSWREFLVSRVGPVDQVYVGDGPFHGRLQSADIGGLRITKVSECALRTRVTRETLRQRDEPGSLFALIQLAGRSTTHQDEREAIQRPGDIVLLGGRPNLHVSSQNDASLVIELSPERLEGLLGSSRLYTALTMEANSPATSLVTRFFQHLVRVRAQLGRDAAARMSAIGTDLLVACIAERLAREVPNPLHGTVLVQRAKAHIEANLGDPSLDPRQLAGAVGVSLRRLQELFHERGQHIDDWIWRRRIEVSARRLVDPATRHLPVSTLAYGCGFTSPAHFSRRFKDRYGMTPRDYREAAHHLTA
jgi:AraC family transcriptional regulator, positive regulator of tynA and feaB